MTCFFHARTEIRENVKLLLSVYMFVQFISVNIAATTARCQEEANYSDDL